MRRLAQGARSPKSSLSTNWTTRPNTPTPRWRWWTNKSSSALRPPSTASKNRDYPFARKSLFQIAGDDVRSPLIRPLSGDIRASWPRLPQGEWLETGCYACHPGLSPSHRGQDVVPCFRLDHHFVRKHAAVPADVLEFFGDLAVVVPHPVAGVARDVELAVGSVARQWRPVLSCEPEPLTVASFCAT